MIERTKEKEISQLGVKHRWRRRRGKQPAVKKEKYKEDGISPDIKIMIEDKVVQISFRYTILVFPDV